MARRAPAGLAVVLVLFAGIVVSLVLAAVVVAAQDTEQVPLSYYTAGGPPNTQVIVIQDPATGDDAALDLTSIAAAASALATGAGVAASKFKKARTATE
ncbi:MAG: hypothetical protein GY911_15770 [Actinomycetales bacterium]|nr:hypothetical protein [Actinomycetales bacterium]